LIITRWGVGVFMVLEDEGDDFTWAGNASTSSAQAIKNPTRESGGKSCTRCREQDCCQKETFHSLELAK